jgi:hypothetical protein
MEKFSHAGVSKYKGEFKMRWCNDALRVKVLAKNGHKDIDIVQLREPMTKADAVAYLLSINFDNGNKEVRAALEAAADKRGVTIVATPKNASSTAKGKAKAPKAAVDTVADEPVMTVAEANARILAQLSAKEAVEAV